MEPQSSINNDSHSLIYNQKQIRKYDKILNKIKCPLTYYPTLNDIDSFNKKAKQFIKIANCYPQILYDTIKRLIIPDYINDNDFIAITKYFFIFLSQFSQETTSLRLIFTTLKRLYCQKFYSSKEILLFIQFYISINSNKNRATNNSHLKISFTFLNEFIDLTEDISIKDNVINTIITLLSEITNLKIKMDFIHESIYDLIAFDSSYGTLSYQTQNILNEWLIRLVTYNYNTPFHYQVIHSIVNQFKHNSFSVLPNRYLDIITKVILKESNNQLNDPYAFNYGFYFPDTVDSKQGSLIESESGFLKNESYCLIFSFKLSSSFHGNCTLVSLYDQKTKTAPLLIAIRNMKLNVTINENKETEWNTNILFEKELSYYLIILQSKPSEKQQQEKIIIYVNGLESESKMMQFPNGEKHTLFIGHNPVNSECGLRGYFGTLMLFCKINNMPLIKEFIQYKGDNYEQMFFNALDRNEKVIEAMRKYNHLKLMISCSWKLRNQTHIDKFKHNLYDISFNPPDSRLVKLTNVFLFKQSKTINEFISLDGIKYLQLLCEYYLIILNEKEMINNTDRVSTM